MNITGLAKIVGCSPSTVSKAFRNSNEISDETKRKIFEAAKKHNCFSKYYSPEFKKRVFAVICHEFSSSVYGNMVEVLHKKIHQNGDFMIVSCNKFVDSDMDEILDYYINFHKIDGIIFIDCPAKHNADILKKIPTVGIGSVNNPPNYTCDLVDTDFKSGIYNAISHFKQMGHTKIGYIGEFLTVDKANNFLSAMKSLNLPINPDWIITSSKRKSEAGFEAADKLLSLESRPTAIFAAYDAIAFGAINKIHQAGLSVPDAFSIIGFDNIPLSEFSTPSLTTISTPTDELADIALDLLYKRLKYPASPFKCVSVQRDLIIRNSVKNLNTD